MGRILIVEPHRDIRSLLEIVITRLGHEPVVGDAADAGLEEVDAAVVEPAEGDGLEIARRLHAHGVPTVFTSIFPAEREALELEPVAYLLKPFPLYAMESALTEALDGADTLSPLWT